MSILITVSDTDNHTISSSKKILSRQGESGEVVTFSVPAAFAATYGLAWIMVQQPDGQIYYIDNGSATGFDHATTNSFTYTLGDRDTMLSVGGQLGIQVVLRDAAPPAQSVEWRSRILYLTIEDSILSNTDSGGSLIDSLSSGTLNRLSDIQYDSLADGDLLYRDTTTGKWRNVTLVDGANISHVLNKATGELTFQATGNISTLASDLVYTDAGGYFTGSDGETIGQEIGSQLASISNMQNDILLRDILRIKMRQTGLNLDPNAWSDTLEDDSGINESLSDYGGLVDGKLTSKRYATLYNANALPQNSTPAWTRTVLNGAESVLDGILTITSGATTGNRTGYARDSGNVLANPTKEILFRAKTTTGGASAKNCGFRISINDGVKECVILFDSAGVIKYITPTYTAPSIATGQPLTEYFVGKITLNNVDGLKVFINGVQVGSTVAYSSILSASNSRIEFDVMAQNAGNVTALIDYLQYTLDNSVTGDATVVWDAQSSTGTLTDAVVEAIESLGTGSITYSISRDGGATFTACTLGTVTDISAQPSGTSIVLKAVISGNAELLAVAWGGQA